MRTATLGPAQRAESLAGMAERELDVLVVGGGVVGAGTALDAVTRGLSTGLVCPHGIHAWSTESFQTGLAQR